MKNHRKIRLNTPAEPVIIGALIIVIIAVLVIVRTVIANTVKVY